MEEPQILVLGAGVVGMNAALQIQKDLVRSPPCVAPFEVCKPVCSLRVSRRRGSP